MFYTWSGVLRAYTSIKTALNVALNVYSWQNWTIITRTFSLHPFLDRFPYHLCACFKFKFKSKWYQMVRSGITKWIELSLDHNFFKITRKLQQILFMSLQFMNSEFNVKVLTFVNVCCSEIALFWSLSMKWQPPIFPGRNPLIRLHFFLLILEQIWIWRQILNVHNIHKCSQCSQILNVHIAASR